MLIHFIDLMDPVGFHVSYVDCEPVNILLKLDIVH